MANETFGPLSYANCLFEGMAGEVFEILMQDRNLHTVLRPQRGTFTPHSQGVEK